MGNTGTAKAATLAAPVLVDGSGGAKPTLCDQGRERTAKGECPRCEQGVLSNLYSLGAIEGADLGSLLGPGPSFPPLGQDKLDPRRGRPQPRKRPGVLPGLCRHLAVTGA